MWAHRICVPCMSRHAFMTQRPCRLKNFLLSFLAFCRCFFNRLRQCLAAYARHILCITLLRAFFCSEEIDAMASDSVRAFCSARTRILLLLNTLARQRTRWLRYHPAMREDILILRAKIIALASLSQALTIIRWSLLCSRILMRLEAMLFRFLRRNQFLQCTLDKKLRMNRCTHSAANRRFLHQALYLDHFQCNLLRRL